MSDEDFQTGSTNVFEFWPGTRSQSLPQAPPSTIMMIKHDFDRITQVMFLYCTEIVIVHWSRSVIIHNNTIDHVKSSDIYTI